MIWVYLIRPIKEQDCISLCFSGSVAQKIADVAYNYYIFNS